MIHYGTKLLVLALLCASCSDGAASETDGGMDAGPGPDGGELALKCNGHEELCDRRFDQVTLAMTHNAMSKVEAGWFLPNQNFGITRQLQDGVRGMMLDTYDEEGELLLCHAYCSFGSQPLVEGLQEIEAFLSSNPHEVVSIIFENYITNAQTAEAFAQSGLIDFVYAHGVDEPWPTLRALIEADTRLIAFQEKLPQDPQVPWLMNIWDHAGETPFSFSSPEDLVCDPNRGDPANPLFLLNHFLTGPYGGSAELAEMVNYNPLFIDRARECQLEWDALPNFVAVDFYDIGDLFEVVDALNGF
jgi:hypothetical protein